MNVINQYLSLIDSIEDYAIFLLDLNGNVLHWNESAKRLSGWEEKEIIGKHFRIFYTQEDRDKQKPEKEIEHVKSFGRIEDEYWRVRKDGTTYWANVVITAIKDKDGRIEGLGKVVRDLTQKRKLELSAETANIRAQFLANMGHEIRTPLAGVVSVGHLLRQTTPITSYQDELIGILIDSSELLTRVINDILDFSELEKSEIKLAKDIFSPFLEVQKIVRKYEIRNVKNVQFQVNTSLDVPNEIIADVYRFEQILANLLDNAYKFTENGKICVSVGFQKDQSLLTVSITDTGIGISADDIPKLFQVFSQVDSSRRKRYRGTGLGLAICKMLAEIMGGKISVTSQIGIGSEFKFTIQCHDIEQSCHALTTSSSSSSTSSPNSKTKKVAALLKALNIDLKILVAEDNVLNQKILRHILQNLGYHCIDVVADGQEAVLATKAKKYDVILMDIQMPVMDGLEATKLIKTQFPTMPIIAMTANVMKEDKELCLQCGMDFFLSKPVVVKDLFSLLHKIQPYNL